MVVSLEGGADDIRMVQLIPCHLLHH